MRRWHPWWRRSNWSAGSPPGQVLADSGYFSLENLEWLEQKEIDAYLPYSNMAPEMNLGKKCRGRARRAVHRRMRQKLRSPQGRQGYAQHKAIVELGFGVLKEQRGMRQFRTRGKEKSRHRVHTGKPCLQPHTNVLRHHSRPNSNQHIPLPGTPLLSSHADSEGQRRLAQPSATHRGRRRYQG
jgi:Transposase DDE domain